MGLIDGLSGVIYSNLIRESRYTLFFDGLVTTLEITVFALLLGIVIGLIVALVRVMHIKVLDKIAKAYVDIIRGTPAVVQLVIIYYGILAVDKGQMEAARSLGMSWGQSMRHIIVPQATKHILPALVNECIQVLKETAIAGYIALDDLTRMGNIIRSRTFDAYTPFIVVAIIYFYTTTILSLFAERLEKRMRASD